MTDLVETMCRTTKPIKQCARGEGVFLTSKLENCCQETIRVYEIVESARHFTSFELWKRGKPGIQEGMMQVLAFPTSSSREVPAERDWRSEFFNFMSGLLDRMEAGSHMEKLWDMTRAIVENKSEMLAQLTLGFVKKNHAALMEQEYCDCPKCQKQLKNRGKHQREIETHVGRFSLSMSYVQADWPSALEILMSLTFTQEAKYRNSDHKK